jgi:hypothetical protein
MRRLVASVLLSSLLCTTLCGCGAIRIQGFFGTDFATVSGFVSGVQVTTVPGAGGTVVVVTIVIFQQTLGFITTNFCGNSATQFPMNSFAQVSFKPGQPCSTIVAIVITG